MASLADIRARLAEKASKSKNSGPSDSAVYPHWNIDEESTATLRFLEDGLADNPFFWVERNMFKFPFNGIKASQKHSVQASDKTVIVQAPCMEMYSGSKCAVLDEVRTWFKDPALEEMGRKYWKKRSYLFQGFVRQNPMTEDVTPENPIRRFIISPQIFTLLENSLMDPDIEDLPTDQDAGLDFRVNKTAGKGGFSDYSTSSWARKETALTDEERAAIEKYGLYNLADFLPKQPDAETQRIIMEMFEASVDGEPYDVERWGMYYTPSGINRVQKSETSAPAEKAVEKDDSAPFATDDDSPTSKVTQKVTPKVTAVTEEVAEEVADEPVAEPVTEPADNKAQDILKMIRSRQK